MGVDRLSKAAPQFSSVKWPIYGYTRAGRGTNCFAISRNETEENVFRFLTARFRENKVQNEMFFKYLVTPRSAPRTLFSLFLCRTATFISHMYIQYVPHLIRAQTGVSKKEVEKTLLK